MKLGIRIEDGETIYTSNFADDQLVLVEIYEGLKKIANKLLKEYKKIRKRQNI